MGLEKERNKPSKYFLENCIHRDVWSCYFLQNKWFFFLNQLLERTKDYLSRKKNKLIEEIWIVDEEKFWQMFIMIVDTFTCEVIFVLITKRFPNQ